MRKETHIHTIQTLPTYINLVYSTINDRLSPNRTFERPQPECFTVICYKKYIDDKMRENKKKHTHTLSKFVVYANKPCSKLAFRLQFFTFRVCQLSVKVRQRTYRTSYVRLIVYAEIHKNTPKSQQRSTSVYIFI